MDKEELDEANVEELLTTQMLERILLESIRGDDNETRKLLFELDAKLRNDTGIGLDSFKTKRFPYGTECLLLDILAGKSVNSNSPRAFRAIIEFGASESVARNKFPDKSKQKWITKALEKVSD